MITFQLISPSGKSIKINPNNIVYIKSYINYVPAPAYGAMPAEQNLGFTKICLHAEGKDVIFHVTENESQIKLNKELSTFVPCRSTEGQSTILYRINKDNISYIEDAGGTKVHFIVGESIILPGPVTFQ